MFSSKLMGLVPRLATRVNPGFRRQNLSIIGTFSTRLDKNSLHLKGLTTSGLVREFSNNDDSDRLPPHKHIVPPMPETPRFIVEPPVRSRPFRNFRGAKNTARRAPKRRVSVPSISLQEHGTYPIQAIHIAQSIDIPKVISKVFSTKAARKMMERLSVVVQLPRDISLSQDNFCEQTFPWNDHLSFFTEFSAPVAPKRTW